MFKWLEYLFTTKNSHKYDLCKDTTERWRHPDQCDLCDKVPEKNKSFGQEHIYPPDMTFTWCDNCQNNRSDECNAKMVESIDAYTKARNIRLEEYKRKHSNEND